MNNHLCHVQLNILSSLQLSVSVFCSYSSALCVLSVELLSVFLRLCCALYSSVRKEAWPFLTLPLSFSFFFLLSLLSHFSVISLFQSSRLFLWNARRRRACLCSEGKNKQGEGKGRRNWIPARQMLAGSPINTGTHALAFSWQLVYTHTIHLCVMWLIR